MITMWDSTLNDQTPVTGLNDIVHGCRLREGCSEFGWLYGSGSLGKRWSRLILKFKNLTNIKSWIWETIGMVHLFWLTGLRLKQPTDVKHVFDVVIVPIGRTDLDAATACQLANAYHRAGARVAMLYELYQGIGRKDAFARCPSETHALKYLATGVALFPLPLDQRPSYYSPDVCHIGRRFVRILFSYLFPLNRWMVQYRPQLIVFMTDAHYPSRHLCLASAWLGVGTLRLQMNGGANDVHQDDTPYYPLFADAMLVWSGLFRHTHVHNYRFSPPGKFIAIGSPKYDPLINACRNKPKLPPAKPHILVISNTQFYKRHSVQSGNPAYPHFADFVISLLDCQTRGAFNVTLKLHPRETLDDLYHQRPEWQSEFERAVVKEASLNALIENASGVVLMASGVLTDCLLQRTPVMVFNVGDTQAAHVRGTLWDHTSPLVKSGAVFLAETMEQASDWVQEIVTGRRCIIPEMAEKLIAMLFHNSGNATQAIVQATWSECRRQETYTDNKGCR